MTQLCAGADQVAAGADEIKAMADSSVCNSGHRFSPLVLVLLAVWAVAGAQAAGPAAANANAAADVDQRKPPIELGPEKLSAQFFLSGSVSGEHVLLAGLYGVAAVTDRALAKWQQLRIPHDVALTTTCLTSAGTGVIGGHEGTLLHSENLVNWRRTEIDPETIVLALYCGSDGTALAVGTFGAVYRSGDGGRTWKSAGPLNTADGLDPHFYAVRLLASGELLIVGEEGAAFQSTDGGASWQEIKELAGASLFGLIETRDGIVYAHGIEGRLIYRDLRRVWRTASTETRAALFASGQVADEVIIAGEDGVWLTVRAGASAPLVSKPRQLPSRATVMAVIASAGEAVLLTRAGVTRLQSSQLKLSATATRVSAGPR